MAITLSILIDLQNSFTAAKSTEFLTNTTLGYLLMIKNSQSYSHIQINGPKLM